ncbi:MAG: hypothetical protein AB1546_15470, partial [bacterium]
KPPPKKEGVLKVIFNYSTAEGAAKCGNAGAYGVTVPVPGGGETTLEVSRDAATLRMNPEVKGLDAAVQKGENDEITLTIYGLTPGEVKIKLAVYTPVAVIGDPVHQQDINLIILKDRPVQLVVPAEIGGEPELVYAGADPIPLSKFTGEIPEPKPVVEAPPPEAATGTVGVIGAASDTVKVEVAIKPAERWVAADAGIDRVSGIGAEVELDGSGSESTSGSPLSYKWTQIIGPGVELKDADKSKAHFAPTQSRAYGFQLEVSDGETIQYDTVTINVPDTVTTEKSLKLLSTTELEVAGYKVFIAGKYAVVVSAGGESPMFQIVDFTDPFAPKKSPVYLVDYEGIVNGDRAYLSGRYLYIAADRKGEGSDSLLIVDLSDVAAPKLIGKYDLSSPVFSLTVKGKYAYLSQRDKGLVILNVSNPSAPVVESTMFTTGGLVWQYGGHVFAAIMPYLRVVDAADPKNPDEVGSIDIFELGASPPEMPDGGGQGQKLSETGPSVNPLVGGYGKYLLVSPDVGPGYKGSEPLPMLKIYDISDPSQPVKAGSLTSRLGMQFDMSLNGSAAYVTRLRQKEPKGEYVVEIVDFTDPQNPVNKGEYVSDKPLRGLGVSGDYVILLQTPEEAGKMQNLTILRIGG